MRGGSWRVAVLVAAVVREGTLPVRAGAAKSAADEQARQPQEEECRQGDAGDGPQSTGHGVTVGGA